MKVESGGKANPIEPTSRRTSTSAEVDASSFGALLAALVNLKSETVISESAVQEDRCVVTDSTIPISVIAASAVTVPQDITLNLLEKQSVIAPGDSAEVLLPHAEDSAEVLLPHAEDSAEVLLPHVEDSATDIPPQVILLDQKPHDRPSTVFTDYMHGTSESVNDTVGMRHDVAMNAAPVEQEVTSSVPPIDSTLASGPVANAILVKPLDSVMSERVGSPEVIPLEVSAESGVVTISARPLETVPPIVLGSQSTADKTATMPNTWSSPPQIPHSPQVVVGEPVSFPALSSPSATLLRAEIISFSQGSARSSLVMDLTPPEYGHVAVRASVDERGHITVILVVQNSAVKEALIPQLPVITSNTTLAVYTQDEYAAMDHQRQEKEQHRGRKDPHKQDPRSKEENEIEFVV